MGEKCSHRIETKITGVDSAFRQAVLPTGFITTVGGNLKRKFDNELCQILTASDIGPIECRQPDCNETDCPDIAHLRK